MFGEKTARLPVWARGEAVKGRASCRDGAGKKGSRRYVKPSALFVLSGGRRQPQGHGGSGPCSGSEGVSRASLLRRQGNTPRRSRIYLCYGRLLSVRCCGIGGGLKQVRDSPTFLVMPQDQPTASPCIGAGGIEPGFRVADAGQSLPVSGVHSPTGAQRSGKSAKEPPRAAIPPRTWGCFASVP